MPTFEQVPPQEVPEKLRQQASIAADRAARDLWIQPRIVWWRRFGGGIPRRHCGPVIERSNDRVIGFVLREKPDTINLMTHHLDAENIDSIVLHEARHVAQLASGIKNIDLERDAWRYADEAKNHYRQTSKEFLRLVDPPAPPPAAERRTRVTDPQELARLRKMAADSLKKRGLQRGGIEIRAKNIPEHCYENGKLPQGW